MFYIEVYIEKGTWKGCWKKIIGKDGVPYQLITRASADAILKHLLNVYYVDMNRNLFRVTEE